MADHARALTAGAEVAETHSAMLFFVGDRAYKLKKPVDLGFLDFRTREARQAICAREVALNRRLAPDVYLGVADVYGPDGELCDHLVVMRRMPADRRLATLATSGADVTGDVERVARVVAAFHERADEVADPASVASADALRANWRTNTERLFESGHDIVDLGLVERVDRLAQRYLDGRRPLLDARIAAGRVRDGHGDLLAGDIFCLDDGPRILDCLEFDDRLRQGDVLLDAAFLAMDLERLGRRDLAQRFFATWHEHTGETHPASLADHYVAYRAQVRALVSCLRCGQGADEAAQAQALLALGVEHLERGRVRLVLVGGLPGTGKSTLSAGLGATDPWCVLRSDEVRKELAGLPASAPAAAEFGSGIYSTAHTDRTYAELLRRARQLLRAGETVILDASWTGGSWRREARRMAAETASDVVELCCVLDPQEAARRLHRRSALGGDASDATAQIAEAMADRADPWPEATFITTVAEPDLVVAAARGTILGTKETGP